jgi:hypothetical protein
MRSRSAWRGKLLFPHRFKVGFRSANAQKGFAVIISLETSKFQRVVRRFVLFLPEVSTNLKTDTNTNPSCGHLTARWFNKTKNFQRGGAWVLGT